VKLAYLTPLSTETIANAKRLGYDAIEVGANWLDRPTLIDLERDVRALRDALKRNKIGITSVAIYGGTIQAPLEDSVAHWERAIKLTRTLGCSVVSGLTGRDNNLTVEDNLPLFQKYFDPITKIAEDNDVRIALEPWPGSVLGHGPYRWTNLATTPELWDQLFEAVPRPSLGLEYDPSHLAWQGIDYVQVIRDYGQRIHHLHAKDIVIDEARLKRVGVHGQGWWRFVIPGLGQIDWVAVFEALKQVGYRGDMAVEHEDNQFLNERWNDGLTLGLKTLRPFVDTY